MLNFVELNKNIQSTKVEEKTTFDEDEFYDDKSINSSGISLFSPEPDNVQQIIDYDGDDISDDIRSVNVSLFSS